MAVTAVFTSAKMPKNESKVETIHIQSHFETCCITKKMYHVTPLKYSCVHYNNN